MEIKYSKWKNILTTASQGGMPCEWQRKRIKSPSQNTVFNLKQSQFLKYVKIWGFFVVVICLWGFVCLIVFLPCLFKTVTFFVITFLEKNPAKHIYKDDYSVPCYQIMYFQLRPKAEFVYQRWDCFPSDGQDTSLKLTGVEKQ